MLKMVSYTNDGKPWAENKASVVVDFQTLILCIKYQVHVVKRLKKQIFEYDLL